MAASGERLVKWSTAGQNQRTNPHLVWGRGLVDGARLGRTSGRTSGPIHRWPRTQAKAEILDLVEQLVQEGEGQATTAAEDLSGTWRLLWTSEQVAPTAPCGAA